MPRKANPFAPALIHLKELNEKIAELTAERDDFLETIARLGAQSKGEQAERSGGGAMPSPFKAKVKSRGRAPGRKPRGGGPTMVALIIEALKAGDAAVGEIKNRIAKKNPNRITGDNASAAISSAIAQHMKGKNKRIKIVKRGGKGVGNTYAAI